MPFVNRLGGAPANLQSKTITKSTDSQIITPDAGYEGIDQVTVSAYNIRCAEALIDSPMEVGEGSDNQSSNNLTLSATLTSCDEGGLPEGWPDLITINVVISSGNVLFISGDSNSTKYDETGIISINAVRKTSTDAAYSSYLSYVTSYSTRSNISNLNNVVKDNELRVYSGLTTSYHYGYTASSGEFTMEISHDDSNFIVYMQGLPKFYTKPSANTSAASIPCTIDDDHFMCSNSANSAIKVKYAIRCFWGVNVDAYPADDVET